METWRRRGCGRLRELSVRAGWSGVFFHHQPLSPPCLLLFPKSSSALQVLGHCSPSPPGDGARGSQASRKAQRLLSSKKGTRFTRRGPQAKTQSKTAPAHFGESKIAAGLEHTCSSRIYTCSEKKPAGEGSPFPTAPVGARRAQPSLSPPLIKLPRSGPVPGKARPRAGMLPAPNRICFPQGAAAPHARRGHQFRIRLRSPVR